LPELKAQPAFLEALQKAGGNQSGIEFDNFRYDWKNVARGVLDGTIKLDNLPAAKPATEPFPTPRQRPARAQQAIFEKNKKGNARPKPIAVGSTPDTARHPQVSSAERAPLRLHGTLTMEQTELYGPPETRTAHDNDEGKGLTVPGGARGVLSNLPSAPALAIKLVAGSEVQFISSNLRATISGDIDFGGTPHDPIVFGTLYTRNGNITFPNARARLESGEITVSARRDPVTDMLRTRVEIDATARGRSGRYEITLRVRGPLDTGEGTTQDLRVDISSDPPLSTDEAFAQLLGTSALGRANADGQQEAYARALVGFLSGPLFSGLERTLEKTLGLDSIALDYRVDEPIGIEIGKAIGDRLYVSYRRSLTRGPAEKTPFDLRIDYRIKGDLQIGIETDENDTRRVTIRKSWRF
jgi:autotransporter translocation and assembly factor TamB